MDGAAPYTCGNPRNSLKFPTHSGGFGLTVPAKRNGDISKAPAPPDPYAVSAAQTQSNKDTASYEAALNRVNQNTPLGSSTWDGTGPGATQTVTLNPLAQQDLTNQLHQDVALSGLGDNLTAKAGDSLQGQIDTSKLPQLSGGPGLYGDVKQNLNYSGAPPVSSDFAAQTKQAQDAVYNQATSRLDPQWNNAQSDLDSKLANQGIVQGSEAYQRAQDEFGRNKNDAYNQANYSAVGAGNQLENQLYGQSLAGRQQAVGEANTQGQFANDAQAQQYAQALQNASFGNQARTQGLTEQTQLQTLPLNELNALRSQSQVQMPTFQSTPQSQVAPTNVSGNVWNAYNAQVANSNNTMNGLFGLVGAGASAIGNAGGIGAFFGSDRRIKRNLKRIGMTPRDQLPVYEFDYRRGLGLPRGRQIGVIAQHVLAKRPEAVAVHPSGYLMVDYARIG